MLKTKKLHRLMAGLLAALMICVSVPSVAYATEGGESIAEFRVTAEFFGPNEEDLGTSKFEIAVGNYTFDQLVAAGMAVPGGYVNADSGKTWPIEVDEQVIRVDLKSEETEPVTGTVNIEYVCDGEVVGKDSHTGEINEYGNIVFHYSDLTAPSGYEITSSGEIMGKAGETVAVNVVSIAKFGVTAEFFGPNEEDLGTSKFEIAVGNYTFDQLVAAGMAVPGGYVNADSGKTWPIEVDEQVIRVDLKSEETEPVTGTVNIEYVCDGEVVGKDSHTGEINEYGNIVFHYSDLTAPSGYEITSSGEIMGKAGETVAVNVVSIAKFGVTAEFFGPNEEDLGTSKFEIVAGNYTFEQLVAAGMTVQDGYTNADSGQTWSIEVNDQVIRVN